MKTKNKEKKLEYFFESNWFMPVCIILVLFIFFLFVIPILTKYYFLFIISALTSFFGILACIRFCKKDIQLTFFKKKMLKKGEKKNAKILGYRKKMLLSAMTDVEVPMPDGIDNYVYTLIVQVDDLKIETPPLIQNPVKRLKNKNCSAYTDGKNYFIYDFEVSQDGKCCSLAELAYDYEIDKNAKFIEK